MTALLHAGNLNTAYTVWRKEQDALIPAIWQNSPFSRGDMATGILLELDTLGQTWESLISLFSIILIILLGIIRNN